MGWEEGAKVVLRLHSASVGKDEEEEEEEEKFLVWCHEAFDRCNWGVKACTHMHMKSMMSVRRDSTWKLLNTYTDTAPPAQQQGEMVKPSFRGISLLLFVFTPSILVLPVCTTYLLFYVTKC